MGRSRPKSPTQTNPRLKSYGQTPPNSSIRLIHDDLSGLRVNRPVYVVSNQTKKLQKRSLGVEEKTK